MLLPEEQLKKLLITAKAIKEDDFDKVKKYASVENIELEEALVSKEIIDESALGVLISNSLKIPLVELSKLEIEHDVLSIIPERIARREKMVAFSRDAKTIKIALANPSSMKLLKMVEHKTGQKISVNYATPQDIDRVFIHYKTDYQKLFQDLLGEDRKQIITTTDYDPPVKKMVDLLVVTAAREEASDIHIEPREKDFLIRFRIDGILRDMAILPKKIHDRIVTRIKVLSRLRIDEHLSSQDGKIRMKADDGNLDLRVSILPIAHGEKIVLRLLTSKARFFSLSDLGMKEADLLKVTQAFRSSYGMIICTGPTGSGKTTTIYTIIKHINTREVNITSIEDPIEYQIEGANQVQVNEKTNLTFSQGLRSVLRQDPDNIFVGEIRDGETAGIAVNAALTGHLVFSTLHTNDAATALPRLFDMKVEPFLVASTISLIIAQRLVRKVCQHCKVSHNIKVEELKNNLSEELFTKYSKLAKNQELAGFEGSGCKFCHDSGYSGRVGIYEVLKVSKDIKKMISSEASAEDITKAATEEGMTSMLDDGMQKVVDGLTTFEEVLRVVKTIE